MPPFDIMALMGGGRSGLNQEALRKFLSGAGAHNQWLELGPYNTYLRRGVPRIPSKGVNLKRPIDLASIERTDLPDTEEAMAAATQYQPAKFRNPKGRFRELMAMLEAEGQKSGYDSVYVENIINPWLHEVMSSMGYNADGQDLRGFPRSMYKRLGVQSGDAWRQP